MCQALFRKHHLAVVKARLGPEGSKAALKAELDRMWDAASQAERGRFEAAAEEDQRRFDRESEAWAAALATAPGGGPEKRTRTASPEPTKRANPTGDPPSPMGMGAIPKKKRP